MTHPSPSQPFSPGCGSAEAVWHGGLSRMPGCPPSLGLLQRGSNSVPETTSSPEGMVGTWFLKAETCQSRGVSKELCMNTLRRQTPVLTLAEEGNLWVGSWRASCGKDGGQKEPWEGCTGSPCAKFPWIGAAVLISTDGRKGSSSRLFAK